MLNDWATARELYDHVRRDVRRRLLARAARPDTWPVWAMVGVTLALFGLGLYAAFNPGWPVATTYLALPPWAFGLYWSRQYALRRVYRPYFRAHGLRRQPRWQRDELLYYVLFREALGAAGWTAERASRVEAYAALLEPPPKPYLFSQNAVFLLVLGVMTGVSTQAITLSTLFNQGGLLPVLALGMASLFIAWTFMDGLHSPRHWRAYVRRELRRASMELP